MNRDTKAELNRRRQACEVLSGTGVRVARMVEHRGIAPRNPAWKASVYLSTPMLGKNAVDAIALVSYIAECIIEA